MMFYTKICLLLAFLLTLCFFPFHYKNTQDPITLIDNNSMPRRQTQLNNISSSSSLPWKHLINLRSWSALSKIRKSKMVKDPRIKNMMKNTSLQILLWTTENVQRELFFIPGNRMNRDCPARCTVTHNKKHAKSAHAIIFTGLEYKLDHSDTVIPINKNQNQLRVFALWESPAFFRTIYNTTANFPNSDTFNWTMTYRLDSTIPAPYFHYEKIPIEKLEKKLKKSKSKSKKKPDPKKSLPTLKPHFFDIPSWLNFRNHHQVNSTPFPRKKLKEYKTLYLPEKKKNLIAWTVTRCTSASNREGFVDQLSNLLPVHRYGECGTFKCRTGRMDKNWTSCYGDLGRSYKFYLALENALCLDYISEKTYYALENNMVPIVYGGVNYDLYVPPGSYINIRDFPTVLALASYIEYLDKNPEEYLKYFLWKEKYLLHHLFTVDHYCVLCQEMWAHVVLDKKGNLVIDPKYSVVHENVTTWFNHAPRLDRQTGNDKKIYSACETAQPFKLM